MSSKKREEKLFSDSVSGNFDANCIFELVRW